MFSTLHRRLVWLYTITTGLILTLVLGGVLLFSIRDSNRRLEEQFHTGYFTILSRLQSGSLISHSWLSQMEGGSQLIIHIEENKIPLRFPGSWAPPTDRQELIEKALSLAGNEGVFLSSPPVSSSTNQTSIMTLSGSQGDRYYAIAAAMATKKGVMGLCLLGQIPPVMQRIHPLLLFLCILEFAGIAGLLLVSHRFVGWSLRPVEESRKKQTQFIASASHELRSPLAVLRSSLDASKSRPDEQEAFYLIMERECERMSRLVGDLLLLASADAGSWSLDVRPFDMDTLLIDLYETWSPPCRDAGVTLELKLPDDPLPAISGDPERLEQILSILLDNALHYTPSGKSIGMNIHTDLPHHRIAIGIWDEGSGIADADKPYIFDRFYQADASRHDKTHFGLGLSIARELAALHHATLSVQNHDGGGAEFLLLLPF